MKRWGYLGLLVVTACMVFTMSACGKKTEESTNEAAFWVSWEGNAFYLDGTLAGMQETLDTLVWTALRDGTVIAEDMPTEDDACIAESESALEDGAEKASTHIWIREVQDAFTAEEGAAGEISHKDYVFYRKDDDTYIGIQSVENGKRWMLLKMEGYGDWLEKEIKMYVRVATGL